MKLIANSRRYGLGNGTQIEGGGKGHKIVRTEKLNGGGMVMDNKEKDGTRKKRGGNTQKTTTTDKKNTNTEEQPQKKTFKKREKLKTRKPNANRLTKPHSKIC